MFGQTWRRRARRGLPAAPPSRYYNGVPKPPLSRPELLAPAGDWDALRAAVANGADAVYFGLSKFSARQRAANFTRTELPDVLAHLHDHNVRGYVALNTLLFSDELEEAAAIAVASADAGADAVIVQDLGLVRLIRRLAPSLPIHASTQMTLTEPRAIEFVRPLGVERVILPRELSMADIRRIREATPMALEVFVHGALCMSYSGQCLASESLWGRSANRGLCGQACRLPYRLIVDGRPRNLGDRAYLLSTKDLAAWDRIADLVHLGIAGFKIEGRLKSAHYVAAAVQVYRAAIDAALAGRPFALEGSAAVGLAQSFSRGFTGGFLAGANHQDLVHGRCPKSRGVRVGAVIGKTDRGVLIKVDPAARRGSRTPAAAAPDVRPGDGLVFDEGRPDEDEQGGRVFSVKPGARPGTFLLSFGRSDINLAAISVGSTVWKTDDPRLVRELEKSYARETMMRRVPLTVEVRAAAGQPLRVRATDAEGHAAEVASAEPLEAAVRQPLTEMLVREQFGRLGNTPFELAAVELVGDAGPAASVPVMAPKSVLNDLRRQAVAALLESRRRAARHATADSAALEHIRAEVAARCPSPTHASEAASALCVLARNLEQLDAVIRWTPPEGVSRPALVYGDFADPGQYADAVTRSHAAGMPVGLATLRISKPGDESLLARLAELPADAILVRHLAGLSLLHEQRPDLALVGDFSLNLVNEIAADVLVQAGLARITPGYDCNRDQLAAMLARFPPGGVEVIVHAHMPMLHMEHCVAAANLSKGGDAASCGRPCAQHRLELRDRIGAEHPLLSDARCRTTLFSAHAQSAIAFLPELARLGVRHFRIELLRETPAETTSLMELYGRTLDGLMDPAAALAELRAQTPAGTRPGTWDFQ